MKVGDRIRLSLGKGPDREGVVVAITGKMVRVRWGSDEETTVVPAPGTVTVLSSGAAPASKAAAGKVTAGKKASAKKATAKKAAPAKKATTTKKATAKKTPSKKMSAK